MPRQMECYVVASAAAFVLFIAMGVAKIVEMLYMRDEVAQKASAGESRDMG